MEEEECQPLLTTNKPIKQKPPVTHGCLMAAAGVAVLVVMVPAVLRILCIFSHRGFAKLEIPAPAEFSDAGVVIQGRDSTISVNTDLNLFSLAVPHNLEQWVSLDGGSLYYSLHSDGSPEGTTLNIDFSGKWDNVHFDNGHATCTVSGVYSPTPVQVSVTRAKGILGISYRVMLEAVIRPKIPHVSFFFNPPFLLSCEIPPVELLDFKVEDVWLQVNPNALSASPLTFSGVWMHLSIGLSCKPVIALGYYPAPSSPVTGCPSFSAMTADRGIDTALTFHLPYTIVATVEVDAQSRVGNATGILYLWGELQWNPASSTLSVTDVDFHPETKKYFVISRGVLCNADWLLHDSLKELISVKLTWDLGAHLEKLKQHLSYNRASHSWLDYSLVLNNLDIQMIRKLLLWVPLQAKGAQSGPIYTRDHHLKKLINLQTTLSPLNAYYKIDVA
ncbi:hypothetical protein Pelo_11859 [Pelomyxa schiedti]|nr:hypothetical protein Pelo_11859 [Pelomyxa schiedti]